MRKRSLLIKLILFYLYEFFIRMSRSIREIFSRHEKQNNAYRNSLEFQMHKIFSVFYLVAIFAMLSIPALSATGEYGIIGPTWGTSALNTGAVAYHGINNAAGNWNTSESAVQGVIPGAGPWTVGNSGLGVGFRVVVGTAPGAGASWTFKLRDNGVNTGLQVVISGTATSGSDTTDPAYSFAAGHLISIQCTPSSSPAPATCTNPGAEVTLEYLAPGSAQFPVIACNTSTSNVPTGATRYSPPIIDCQVLSAETLTPCIVCESVTISQLYVNVVNAPGAGQTIQVNVRKTHSGTTTTTALTTTISGASSTSNQDTTHSFTLVAGDTFDVQIVNSSGASTNGVRWGMLYTGSTNGSIPQIYPSCSLAQNSNQFGWGIFIRNTESGPSGTIAYPDTAPCNMTISNLYIQCFSGFIPAAGTTLTLTGRDGGNPQNVSAVVTGTGSTGNDTSHTWSVTKGDVIDWNNVTTAVGASGTFFSYGHMMTITQPSGTTIFQRRTPSTPRAGSRGISQNVIDRLMGGNLCFAH